MKKYTKLITLILSLAVIFSLFSGFTYSPLATGGIVAGDQPRSQTIKQNKMLGLGFFVVQELEHDIEYKWYQCDDVNKTNPILIQTKTETNTSGGISSGSEARLYNKKMDVLGTYYFYCVAKDLIDNSTVTSQVATITVVENSEVLPVYDIVVKVWYGDAMMLDTKCYDGQILTLADPNVNPMDKFLGWKVNNLIEFVTSPITINKSMIGENGYVSITGHYVSNAIEKFKVTFKSFNDGWLFFDSTTTLTTSEIKSGQAVGIDYDFIGANFSHYSTDKQGVNKVTNDYIITKDIVLYVNNKDLKEVTVKYLGLADDPDPSGRGYGIYKTVKVNEGSKLEVVKCDRQWKSGVKFYDFVEWTFDKKGLEKVPSGYIVTEDISLYAQYTQDPVVEKTPFAQLWDYIVAFFGWIIKTVVSVLNWIFGLFA